jgi:hypothetical protein
MLLRDGDACSVVLSVGCENASNEKGERLIWSELLLARQLTKSTVLSAQRSILDKSADLPSAYFPRRSTRQFVPCGTLAHVHWPAFSEPSTRPPSLSRDFPIRNARARAWAREPCNPS